MDLVIGNNKIEGVKKTHDRFFFFPARTVILTTGTFLKGRIIIGDVSYDAGPDGLLPANSLSESLKRHGIELMRFKTGTPARINRRSIDFSKMIEQPGDDPIVPFSFERLKIEREQISCYLLYSKKIPIG